MTKLLVPMAVVFLLALGIAAVAQPVVEIPRVTYVNSVAGVSIDIPEDWEMGTNDWGSLFIGLGADMSPGNCSVAPQLWFFYCQETPEQMAELIQKNMPTIGATDLQARATGNGTEWEVTFTSNGAVGALHERWLCRTERGVNYVIASMVKPEVEEMTREDVEAALASCHVIGGPRMKREKEPTENAFRMLMPRDWTLQAAVVRDMQTPGYFEWKAASPDALCGAFSAKPTVFNIAVPYIPAEQAAEQLILPELQKQIPGVQLEAVHPLPRVGAYYRFLIKTIGLGDRPQVDRVWADYVAERNGTPIRLRLTVGTLQMDQSEILGGRGDWTLFACGAWAPVDRFEELYPLGRGVIASLATDPDWKDKQFGAVGDVALDRAWLRDAASWCWDVILTRMN